MYGEISSSPTLPPPPVGLTGGGVVGAGVVVVSSALWARRARWTDAAEALGVAFGSAGVACWSPLGCPDWYWLGCCDGSSAGRVGYVAGCPQHELESASGPSFGAESNVIAISPPCV